MDVTRVEDLREQRGHQIYELADLVEKCIALPGTFLELGFQCSSVSQRLARPNKASLLYDYIYAMCYIERHREYRKHGDFFGSSEADKLCKLASEYEIRLTPFEEFCDDPIAVTQVVKEYYSSGANVADRFYLWILAEDERLGTLWEYMTEEVFELLFGNRRFLLTFNSSLSEYLKANPAIFPLDATTERGRIKRCSYLPKWLKNAVYFRDHGRCVLCQRDLTGLLEPESQLHYDHMVPLDRYGTNDPANFQLLCSGCNLKKGSRDGTTSYLYPAWWN